MAFPKAPAILASRDLREADLKENPTEALVRIYAWMQLARVGDNRILDLFRQGIIRGTVTGGQGNEWMIVPLALLADKAVDVVSFTHRGFGGHLIWGGHLVEHLNQYFANADSPTRAREGNIHHGDPANRSLPMISHLGAMCGTVLGATDSQRRFGRKAVGFAFFGDGSSSTGDVHESMNLASLLSLPIVFVIENNRYAYSTPTSEQFAAGTELWKRAAGYGMEGLAIGCGDPGETARTLAGVIEKVRSTSRPMLVEAHTLRLRGHAAYDTCDYLQPGEADEFFANGPLGAFPSLRRLERPARPRSRRSTREIGAFIEACIKVAIDVPRPDPSGMEADLYAPVGKAFPWKPEPAAEESLTMAQALNRATRKILTERPESIVLGQDIATYGGAFKVTENLFTEFGRSRVLQHAPGRERLHRLRDRHGGQRAQADRGVPVCRLCHGGRDADHPQRRDDAFPLGRRVPARPAAALRRRRPRLLPFPGARIPLPLHARAQGPLPEHAPGRLQRAPRRERGRQSGPALRAQGALPPREASGGLGSRLRVGLASEAPAAGRLRDSRHLRGGGPSGAGRLRLPRIGVRGLDRGLRPALPLAARPGPEIIPSVARTGRLIKSSTREERPTASAPRSSPASPSRAGRPRSRRPRSGSRRSTFRSRSPSNSRPSSGRPRTG